MSCSGVISLDVVTESTHPIDVPSSSLWGKHCNSVHTTGVCGEGGQGGQGTGEGKQKMSMKRLEGVQCVDGRRQ